MSGAVHPQLDEDSLSLLEHIFLRVPVQVHPDLPRSPLFGLPDLLYDPSLIFIGKKFLRMLFEKHLFHRRGRRERGEIDKIGTDKEEIKSTSGFSFPLFALVLGFWFWPQIAHRLSVLCVLCGEIMAPFTSRRWLRRRQNPHPRRKSRRCHPHPKTRPRKSPLPTSSPGNPRNDNAAFVP